MPPAATRRRPDPTPDPSPELPALRLALRVAELGSVAAAAREADALPATATAAIRRLEASLGARLFTRGTRALKCTPEGEAYLARAREALALLTQGAAELHAPLTQVRGTVRLAVPVDLGTQVLRPMLARFAERYPQVQLELRVADRVSDIGREPVDAGLRYGEPAPGGEALLRPMAADNVAILVASPDYLARAGTPRTVAELAQHQGIGLRLSNRPALNWPLIEGGRPVQAALRVRLITDNGLLARLWALDGQGIALKSRLDVLDDLRAGRLRRVLPQVHTAPYPLNLVMMRGTQQSARMRALADHLQGEFQALAAEAAAY